MGTYEGLHIDSYKKINHVDGYKLNLKYIQNSKYEKNEFFNKEKSKKNLWFINMGGYDPSSVQEKHKFGLIVASSKLEAKKYSKI